MFWLFIYVLIFGTVGVFQAVIFISINAVAIKRSRFLVYAVTAGWGAFTLFGSIYTHWLLLLQLCTVVVSCGIALRVIDQSKFDAAAQSRFFSQPQPMAAPQYVPQISTPPAGRPAQQSIVQQKSGLWLPISALALFVVVLALMASKMESKESSEAPAVAADPPATAAGSTTKSAPPSAPLKTSRPSIKRKHHRKAEALVSHQKQRDFQDCLKLATDDEVMECAKTAR